MANLKLLKKFNVRNFEQLCHNLMCHQIGFYGIFLGQSVAIDAGEWWTFFRFVRNARLEKTFRNLTICGWGFRLAFTLAQFAGAPGWITMIYCFQLTDSEHQLVWIHLKLDSCYPTYSKSFNFSFVFSFLVFFFFFLLAIRSMIAQRKRIFSFSMCL